MKKFWLAALVAIIAAGFPVTALAQDQGTVVSDGDVTVVSDEDAVGDGAAVNEALKPWEAHPEFYELVDTVRYVKVNVLDSALVDKDIFAVLAESDGRGTVRLNQSDDIQSSMEAHFEANAARRMLGYRVRIFFDNKQSARADSEATMEKFKSLFPEVEVFRSYVNPYFKVTVGNYRTRSEAMRLLRKVAREFPTAFIVREEIEYPPIESGRDMVLDSVSFYRYIGPAEEVVEAISL